MSKGCEEKSYLVRFMMENMRDLNQVVPHLGKETKRRSSFLGLKCLCIHMTPSTAVPE